MNYLICQDWWNTSNNHAGMKYLCKYLEKEYPHEFKTITILEEKQKKCNNRIVNKIRSLYNQHIHDNNIKRLCEKLIVSLSDNDSVFLMEYFDKGPNQYIIANYIKKHKPQVKIYGLSHLVPSKIGKLFPDKDLYKWSIVVDKIITLGSSLSKYYISRGISEKKLITTFHYVDSYYNTDHITVHPEFTVIAMGNQMRNLELLVDIVKSNKEVKFIICQGGADLSKQLSLKNVQLVPFVSENELRDLMKSADVSLNVMYDTIGSNVIVTSMAMGLAMICSNVGSIKDYCDENNTIFCSCLEDFNLAINKLKTDKSRLQQFKESSIIKSKTFSIENFYTDLKNKIH